MAWGVWRIPESELCVLGQLEGRDVLELGCGAAQWTLALVHKGARAVGLDLSEQQLAHARALSKSAATSIPVVQGNAERLPFLAEAFDIVFCDHGATVFAPPEATVSEAIDRLAAVYATRHSLCRGDAGGALPRASAED